MSESWEPITKREACQLFWQLASRIHAELAELRKLRTYINQRWGRAPKLPEWAKGVRGDETP